MQASEVGQAQDPHIPSPKMEAAYLTGAPPFRYFPDPFLDGPYFPAKENLVMVSCLCFSFPYSVLSILFVSVFPIRPLKIEPSVRTHALIQ